jgi:hypothetical protein
MGAKRKNQQEDPDKYFGKEDYFKNKDQQRRAVNNLRREERNARIMQQGLTRNIKKLIRDEKDPSGLIRAAEALGVNPVGGGGFGEEASDRDARLKLEADQNFNALKRAEEQRFGKNKPNAPANAPAGTDASAPATTTPPAAPTATTPTVAGTEDVSPTKLDAGLMMDDAGGKYSTDLAKRANAVLSEKGDSKQFEQGLSNAMGMAKTQKEIDELRQVAIESGIPVDRFNAQANPSLLQGAPEWAKDVKNDSTFKGQDLTRFGNMTREEARAKLMSERASKLMGGFNKAGRQLSEKEENENNLSRRTAEYSQQLKDLKSFEATQKADMARKKAIQDKYPAMTDEERKSMMGLADRAFAQIDKAKNLSYEISNYGTFGGLSEQSAPSSYQPEKDPEYLKNLARARNNMAAQSKADAELDKAMQNSQDDARIGDSVDREIANVFQDNFNKQQRYQNRPEAVLFRGFSEATRNVTKRILELNLFE